MRAASISQQDVSAAAERLVAAGLRPTARAIRDELGKGSMATVLRFVQAWQATQPAPAARPTAIPAGVQQAVLEYAAQEVSSARLELEQELASTRQAQKELLAEYEAQSARLEALTVELAHAQQVHHQLEGRHEQLKTVTDEAQRVAQTLRDTVSQLQLDNALLTQRLEAVPTMEAELARLRAALEAERNARVLAEQQAAVAQAKLER